MTLVVKLQPKTGTDKPFDVSFEKFSEHPEVLQHLTPLQSIGAHKQDTSTTFSGGKGKGGNQSDGKGKSSKGKGKANTGIAVPDDCEIFVDGKQLCKRWQVGRCTAKDQTWKTLHGWVPHVLEEVMSQTSPGQRVPTLTW